MFYVYKIVEWYIGSWKYLAPHPSQNLETWCPKLVNAQLWDVFDSQGRSIYFKNNNKYILLRKTYPYAMSLE